MMGRITGMVASLVLLSPTLVGAQVPTTATDIPWEEIQARGLLHHFGIGNAGDGRPNRKPVRTDGRARR